MTFDRATLLYFLRFLSSDDLEDLRGARNNDEPQVYERVVDEFLRAQEENGVP